MNTVIDLIKSHRSIRNFQEREIDDAIVEELVSAARYASTSSFVQAYTLIRVRDKKNKEKIARLAGDQKHIVQCPVFFIFCADLKRLDGCCRKEGAEMVHGMTGQFIVATVDTALIAQNLMLAAESLGMGGVYIGGIRNDPEQVCKLLDIPDLVFPVFGMCLGYPDQDPESKPRLPLPVVMKEGRYRTEGEEELIDDYDRVMEGYYSKRTGGKRKDTWRRQMAELMSKKTRPHMKEFLARKGFELK